jgi:WXG100 family type VII secretion target
MVSSAVHVYGQGEGLAAEHASADSRIEAAQAGWAGASAAAMTARSAKWMQTSAVLVGRLSTHSQDLHTCACTFAETEQHRAEAIKAVGDAAHTVAGRADPSVL